VEIKGEIPARAKFRGGSGSDKESSLFFSFSATQADYYLHPVNEGEDTETIHWQNLANFLIEGLKAINSGVNPVELKRGMDKATTILINNLRDISRDVVTNEEIKQIATISANNDSAVGAIIAEAMESVGKNGVIQVEESKTAALITRKVNASGLFPVNLVKVAHKGDTIILGFDTVSSTEPVFVNQIGYQKSVLAEVKVGADGKFYIYLDKRRSARTFAKLAGAKTFVKRLDKDLQSTGETIATYEESDD
jgi:hypothetical protein